MTVSASFHTKRREANGSWQYRVRFTGRSAQGGAVDLVSGWHRRAMEPMQATIDALVSAAEDVLAQEELEQALSDIELARETLQTVTLAHNTPAKLRRRLFRRLFNRMRIVDTDMDKWDRVINVIPDLDRFTNAQLANFTGLTPPQVNARRTKLKAYQASSDTLDHGDDELPDD